MSNRPERPICRRCNCEMKIVRVEPGRDRESRVYRCIGHGCEAAVVLEPLA
jgi:hypothetical protein